MPGEEKPFTLSVSDTDLDLLHKKLDLARFPDELNGVGWDYGAPLGDVKRLAARWKDGFDWRKAETDINTLPMFTRDVEIDGFGTLNIHYIHKKSEVPNAVPLLFSHGWPGHFLEVEKMLPLLTAASPDHPSFHVVAPSLPNFGFSETVKKPGFTGAKYAEAVHKLILALGYNEYVYQGGDWGMAVGSHAVTQYGHKHVKAWHSNLPVPRRPTLFTHPLLYLGTFLIPFDTNAKMKLAYTAKWNVKERGYFIEQATKPQTIGYPLEDSPVGLLAWIYEKLVGWTDEYPWTDDEVLKWVSIYWFSRGGPAASLRIYYEMTAGGTQDTAAGTKWMSVPLGVSYFPREIFRFPNSWSHTIGKLVFESEHAKGGHFAAFEHPNELAGDLRKMFGKGGPAYGVVPGKNGYA